MVCLWVIPLGSAERSRCAVSPTCALVLGEVTTFVACCGPPTPGFGQSPALVLGPLCASPKWMSTFVHEETTWIVGRTNKWLKFWLLR